MCVCQRKRVSEDSEEPDALLRQDEKKKYCPRGAAQREAGEEEGSDPK